MTARSSDSLIEIEFVQKPSDCIFPAADWSVVNMPETLEDTKGLVRQLYNTPQSNHITLVLNRHSRKKRVSTAANIGAFQEPWQYLETVSIAYEKPNSCSNNGLLPVSEVGSVFFKGDKPNCHSTEWFSGGVYNNATNFWDVSAREEEGEFSYYQKFSTELNLILRSLCGTMSTRKFIYCVDNNAEDVYAIHKFCKKYNYTCKIYFFDKLEARKATEIVQGL